MTSAFQKTLLRKLPKKDACLGKTKWGTEKTAQAAISRLRRENPREIDSTVRPYRCNFCKRWHVGHGA